MAREVAVRQKKKKYLAHVLEEGSLEHTHELAYEEKREGGFQYPNYLLGWKKYI